MSQDFVAACEHIRANTETRVVLYDHVTDGDLFTVNRYPNMAESRLAKLGRWTMGLMSWRAFWCGKDRVLVVWKGARSERVKAYYLETVQPELVLATMQYLEETGKVLVVTPEDS